MISELLFDSTPQDGGGFYEGLSTILELNDRISVKVYVLNSENLNRFRGLGIVCEQVKLGSHTRLLNKLESRALFPIPSCKNFSQKNIHFVCPSRIILNKKSGVFSGTIWDLCHIDMPQFPEVGSYREYNYRNYLLERYVSRMNFVVVDSCENALKLEKYFRIPQKRIVVLPFNVPKSGSTNPIPGLEHLEKFFFYPAQLWKHKNHKNLLLAFEKLLKHRQDYSLVLTGSHKDPQVLEYISSFCKKYPDHVKYLGFIDYSCISWLYKRCSALVYPSYFGPTNLPPIEAISVGADVILSQEMKNEIGNVATYFDPTDPVSIFKQLKAHTCKHQCDPSMKIKFINGYYNRRQEALDSLAEKLLIQRTL